MAAAFWHLLIAEHLRKNLQNNDAFSSISKKNKLYKIVNHKNHFFAGTWGPDINYFPKGDKKLSNFAHRNQPLKLGLTLYNNAKTGEEIAYSIGWLLHIISDIIGHKLVNRLVSLKLNGNKQEYTKYSENPSGHYRIEWGIDCSIIKNPNPDFNLPERNNEFAECIGDVTRVITLSYEELYNYKSNKNTWLKAHKDMIHFVKLFYKAWKITGRIDKDNNLFHKLKSLFFYSTIFPTAYIVSNNTFQKSSGVLIPILPDKSEECKIYDYTQNILDYFIESFKKDFQNITVSDLEG